MPNKKIILVDDNQANLTACKETLQDLFDVFPVLSAEKMFELLNNVMPDLILLDVDMPVMNGYEALRQLRNNDAYKNIPVIFVTALDDYRNEIDGLKLGAVDYITKPFVSANLIKRVEKHLVVNEGKKEISMLNKAIEELLLNYTGNSEQKAASGEELVRELLAKVEIMTSMVHAMQIPLSTVIERMQAAMALDCTGAVTHCLSIANTEAALVQEIANNILGVENDDIGKS